ncbi:reverse transcriptase [Tanacetum coccineum]
MFLSLSATRTNSTTTEEILASLREPIAQLMREEIEKLREEMRTTAIEVDNVPDEQKVPLISIHLFDIALMWHRQFMRLLGSDTVPWLVYRGAIMQRFGNSFDDPLGELKNCKYENSIEDYQNNFDKLLSRVDIREDQAISFYMAGLPTDIELAVRMFKPQTLSVAYSLSKLQIETNEATKKKNKAPLFPTPKFNSYTSGGSQISVHKPYKLCCNKCELENMVLHHKYVPGHKCTGQVYLLEVFLDEEESQEEEEIVFGTEEETSQLHQIFAEGPQISLHAIWDTKVHNTLRVIALCGCQFNSTFEDGFDYKGKTLILRGTTKPVAQWMSGKQAAKTGNQASNLAMCVYPTAMLNMLSARKFVMFLKFPFVIPPKRDLWTIRDTLRMEHIPINISLRISPISKKDAIESMVKELLDSGVIRHSQSSFSSPVVMVKKKDGSWRIKDASGVGIGDVLQQNGHPIAFLSKTLAPKHQVLSTYEKEFLAVIQALEKWRAKLGFDYEIVYKKGAENVVADALSRVQGQTECLQLEVTTLSSELYDKVKRGWSEDSQLKAKIEKLQSNSGSSKHYSWSNGQLLRKGKLVISNDEALRKELMQHFHSGPTGGHSGMQAIHKTV